jgi:hypothetical protein
LGVTYWSVFSCVIITIYNKASNRRSYRKYVEFATLIVTIGSFLILTSSFMSGNSNNLSIQNNDMNLKLNETTATPLKDEAVIREQVSQNSNKIHIYNRISSAFLLSGLVLIILSLKVTMLDFRER